MINKEVIKPINYLLEKQASDLKNKLAFSDQNEDITYKQLNFETANLAKCFKNLIVYFIIFFSSLDYLIIANFPTNSLPSPVVDSTW